jgi:hypothetical protein
LPAYLKLAGVVEMGKEAIQTLNTGDAIRISTGGMMPPDADAVVMVEYTDETDGGLVEIHRGVAPWQNVIQIGDDIKKGEPVFRRGRRLRAHDLGALTGVGISSIAVHKKPRVALISTGDEIVDAETEPRPGQVRNINQHSLAGLIEEVGGELKDWGVIATIEINSLMRLAQRWNGPTLCCSPAAAPWVPRISRWKQFYPSRIRNLFFTASRLRRVSRRSSPRHAASRFLDCPATLFLRSSSSICSVRRC